MILMAVLFYLDKESGLLVAALTACVFHELGHIAVVYILGGNVKGLNLSATGAELVLGREKNLSYGKEVLVALAGPLSSFVCAGLAAGAGAYLLAGMSVGQGCFNLLPVYPLDGGRVLYGLLSMWGRAETAERVLDIVSVLLTGALLGLGGILLRQFGNPTLIITVCWLLLGGLRRMKGKKIYKSEKMLA